MVDVSGLIKYVGFSLKVLFTTSCIIFVIGCVLGLSKLLLFIFIMFN